jgi:hypothetical protein
LPFHNYNTKTRNVSNRFTVAIDSSLNLDTFLLAALIYPTLQSFVIKYSHKVSPFPLPS